MIGDHEYPLAGDRRPPIAAASGDTRSAFPFVVPDLAAAPRVERDALVRRGHVHDPVGDDRRDLQQARVGQRVHPSGREPGDALPIDLSQLAVAVAARRAVVGGPTGIGAYRPEQRAVPPQQPYPVVVGPELEIREAFVEHDALDGASVGGLHGQTAERRLLRLALYVAQVRDQPAKLGGRQRGGRHALPHAAASDQRGQLRRVERSQAEADRGTAVAPLAVGAMTSGASGVEDRFARIGLLGKCGPRTRQEQDAERDGADAAGVLHRLHTRPVSRRRLAA